MEEEKSSYLTCQKKDFQEAADQTNSKDLGEEVKRIALSQGFKVLKSTGNKKYSLYFVCNRSGKKQVKAALGERTRLSKNIGNFLISSF